MMKKIKWLMLCVILCAAGLFTGCNRNTQTNEKITIVCTNYALYDWTSQLVGDCDAEVILLLNNGTDMHSFQPSAQELIQIADCNVLVHVGGESDAWLMDALAVHPNEERNVVNLTEVLADDILEEHFTEGMQGEHTHADGSVCAQEHSHEEHEDVGEDAHSEGSVDEHVWLSLRMAMKSCDAIEEALCNVMPAESELIRSNAESYRGKLEALDRQYEDAVTNSNADNVVIVADRFPFLYLMEDYGIQYYAAFPGCSTESEADFETVVFMAEKVTEYNTGVLLITESGTDTLAMTVFDNAGLEGEVAVLHSMQVVYQSDIEAGVSYISYMEANLEVLKRVLDDNGE